MMTIGTSLRPSLDRGFFFSIPIFFLWKINWFIWNFYKIPVKFLRFKRAMNCFFLRSPGLRIPTWICYWLFTALRQNVLVITMFHTFWQTERVNIAYIWHFLLLSWDVTTIKRSSKHDNYSYSYATFDGWRTKKLILTESLSDPQK